MGLETPTYIGDLVDTNPAAGDNVSEGDNHLRNIKTAVQGSFPSLGSAAVTATAVELNQLSSVTVGGTSSGDIVTIDNTQTLTNKTLTSPTINGKPGKGIVILDDPEVIEASPSYGAWTSSSGFSSTTLTDAGATAAIIRIEFQVTHTTTALNGSALIRQAGSAASTGTRIGQAIQNAASSMSMTVYVCGEGAVALDGSYDFEYYLAAAAGTPSSDNISLIGYYV